MTDPLSITAGAVGLLSFGISSCKGILDFYQSVRNSREDIRSLCESAEALHKILQEISHIIDRPNFDRNTTTTVLTSIDACRAGLARLSSKMEKLHRNETNRGLPNLPSALKYPFKESTVAKLKEIVIHELVGNLKLAISVLNINVSDMNHQAVLDRFSATNANVDSLREETRGRLDDVRDRISTLTSTAAHPDGRREDIIKWIARSDFVTDHHRAACELCEPHTGNWFIQGNRYKEWRDTPGSFLWLYGIPGCGKTILCSTIIKEIIAYCSCRDSCYVAYYYFTFNDSERQKPKTLLRSLLLQLFRQQLSIPDALLDIYMRYKHEDPPESGLMAALRSIIEKMDKTYVIIDALDECPSNRGERTRLISILDELRNFNLPNLHILVTSRKEPGLDDLSRMVTSPPIGIQSSEVDIDIQLYVQNQLSVDSKLSCWPLAIREDIERTLVKGASGMFRWVSCQLDSLRTCLRPSAVRRTLQSLPKTLDDTYDRILLGIEEERYQEALSALTWLLFSNQPLRIEEIAEAMVIDVSAHPLFDPNERLFDSESVLTILSSLVTESKPSYDYRRRTNVREIRLAHFSVKEYLTSSRVIIGPASRFYIKSSTAHYQILKSCLCYITSSRSITGTQMQVEMEFPLIRYACDNWFVHAKRCEDLMTDTTKKLIIEFLNTKENMCRWMFFFQPEDRQPNILEEPWRSSDRPVQDKFRISMYDRKLDSRQTETEYNSFFNNDLTSPLYYATSVELNDIVDTMLAASVDVNGHVIGHGRLYEDSLILASLKGYTLIVQRLLAHGADLNGRGGKLCDALQAACYGGHAEIVGQLIEAGADVNLQGIYPTSLDAALDAITLNPQVISQLLERNVRFDHHQHGESRLMRWAAIEGHEAVVSLILARLGNLLMTTSSYHWTLRGYDHQKEGDRSYRRQVSAPYEAIFHKHENVAKLLLEWWRNVEEEDDEHRTALYWACFHSSEGIVRMLLDKGANIHSVGPNGWTARYWATWKSDEIILGLLNTVCNPDHCSECASAEMKAIEDIQVLSC